MGLRDHKATEDGFMGQTLQRSMKAKAKANDDWNEGRSCIRLIDCGFFDVNITTKRYCSKAPCSKLGSSYAAEIVVW